MREHDRLVRNIALCVIGAHESLKEAEKAVRKNLHLSSLQNHKSELEVLRDMWQKLKKGQAHRTLNEMIRDEYIRPLNDDEDFDAHKAILKDFQRRARQWHKTRKELENHQ